MTLEAFLSNVNSMGLIYDGLGVLVLGAPGFFRVKKNIEEDSKTALGVSPAHVKALTLLRLDTAAGSILLFFGFVFQLIAGLGIRVPYAVCLVFWAILVAYPLTYWFYLRAKLHTSWSEEIIAKLIKAAGG